MRDRQILSNTQNKGVKYDITTTERCPLCEEDIQVGTAGPQGLAQHRGKKKCLAAVKKKQQDAVMAKKPTLFSYLRRQNTTLPTITDLAREAERNEIESSSRIVVSQVTKPDAFPETYAGGEDDRSEHCEGEDPSAGQDLDSSRLDSDLDRDEPHAWLAVRAGPAVRACEPGCELRTRSTTPNANASEMDIQIVCGTGTPNEAENAQGLARRHDEESQARPQVMPTRNGCRQAWLLLDRLRAEIGSVREALEDNEGNELWGYDRSAAFAVCADVPQDEIWENVNPGLDRILGFGRPQEEITTMIRHSRESLQGLYEYLEVLVEQGGVVGGLLEGKVTALMGAMAE